MQIAIVGLAGSGKTTVFNTLTRGHAETGGFGGVHAQRRRRQGPRRAARPAGRDLQAQEDRPGRRHLRRPAGAAGLDRGPRRDRGAAGRAPRPAARLGRAAPRRPRVRGPGATRIRTGRVDPARDIERLDLEFILADLAMVERRLERLEASGRHGTPAEREANEREEVVLAPAPAGARGRLADPRRRPRRRRGEGDPRLPVPDPEAGPRAAQRRRGRPRRRRRARRPAIARRLRRTGTRWSRRCRRGSRWSSASSSPTRRRSSWRSSGSPSRASTGSSPCPTGCSG